MPTADKQKLLTQNEAEKLVEQYIAREESMPSNQELLDSDVIPRLKGYKVQPGKVSDSIFGGRGYYVDKATGKKAGFENPDEIGPYMRTLISMHRDTMGVAIR